MGLRTYVNILSPVAGLTTGILAFIIQTLTDLKVVRDKLTPEREIWDHRLPHEELCIELKDGE